MMLDEPPPAAETSQSRILLIVDQSMLTAVSDKLTQYSDDIFAEGGSVEIRPFPSEGSAVDLKDLIKSNRSTIDGVFLVGNLPSALYEQTAFGKHEEFPIDLFLMDLDANWIDENKNGIYDGHSPLNLTIFASRINGTTEEINNYFTRLHNHRSGSYEYLGGAFIFKDDDWFDTYSESSFGLERLYDSIRINDNVENTAKDNYIYSLSTEGADYVYQWIHATPNALYFNSYDNYDSFRYSDISPNNIRSRFLNMFNCKGARFTQNNIAMTYLTDTETGIAITGSTKVGGNYYPLEFHRTLTLGSNWGNAFKSWYNYYGKNNDEWFLGMVILGDPSIKIKDAKIDRSLDRSSFQSIIPPSQETIRAMGENLVGFEGLETTF